MHLVGFAIETQQQVRRSSAYAKEYIHIYIYIYIYIYIHIYIYIYLCGGVGVCVSIGAWTLRV